MIELRMLGTLDLKGADGRAVHTILAQPKRLALLAYLAVHTTGARRDSVVALFWPELDTAHARGALRQSLRFLRRELGDGILNGHSDEAIEFEPATVWCDVVAFEQACKAGRAAQALQLYRGAFLDGCFVSGGSPELERWITAERTRLGQLAVRAAAEVVEHAEREGDLPTAVQAARHGVALDPDDESALARLVALLDRSGDRAGALSAFETFRRRLQKEYDATPSPETDARVRAIRARQIPFVQAAPAPRRVAARLTPARRRRWRRVLWPLVGGAVATATIGWLVSGTPRTSVAVLPLSNTTQDSTLTYLAEGLTQGVTAALSRVPGLRVADPVAMQDVDAAVAWTLRRQGDSLVLAVELRRAATGARHWSGEFPLSASGALAVEGRVLGDVVRELQPRAADSIDLRKLQRTTTSADAYLLYLQGRYFLGRRSGESIARARGLFAQAIERDPVYAAAYAGLGYSYVGMAYYLGNAVARGISIGRGCCPPRTADRLHARLRARADCRGDGELSSAVGGRRTTVSPRSRAGSGRPGAAPDVRRLSSDPRTLRRSRGRDASGRRAGSTDPPFLVSAGSGPGVRRSSGRRGCAIRKAAGARLDLSAGPL